MRDMSNAFERYFAPASSAARLGQLWKRAASLNDENPCLHNHLHLANHACWMRGCIVATRTRATTKTHNDCVGAKSDALRGQAPLELRVQRCLLCRQRPLLLPLLALLSLGLQVLQLPLVPHLLLSAHAAGMQRRRAFAL